MPFWRAEASVDCYPLIVSRNAILALTQKSSPRSARQGRLVQDRRCRWSVRLLLSNTASSVFRYRCNRPTCAHTIAATSPMSKTVTPVTGSPNRPPSSPSTKVAPGALLKLRNTTTRARSSFSSNFAKPPLQYPAYEPHVAFRLRTCEHSVDGCSLHLHGQSSFAQGALPPSQPAPAFAAQFSDDWLNCADCHSFVWFLQAFPQYTPALPLSASSSPSATLVTTCHTVQINPTS